MRQKEYGIWEETSWSEWARASEEIALGLIRHGFEAGQSAAILSNTRREWAFSDLGILTAGGISAGIYPTDAANQVEYLLNDSGAIHLFVEDEEQLDKILEVRARVPKLRKIIVFDDDDIPGFSDPMVMSLAELRSHGTSFKAHAGDIWNRRIESRSPSDVAVLVYTSGTTGKPKGAQLTHDNLVFTAQNLGRHVMPQDARDERIGYLPLCHVAERCAGLFVSICTGSVMNYVERPEAVLENIREIQPTLIFGVPRMWEKFYSTVTLQMQEAPRLARWAYRVAFNLGRRIVARERVQQPVPLWLRVSGWIARKLVLRNILVSIGLSRCRTLFSGAAPISPELLHWYSSLGVQAIELYGLTECTGILTCNPPGKIRIGTVGPAVPFSEMKLSPDGEILARGRNVFSGYLNDEAGTAQALREGWLHTGDVGALDEEGYLRIIDRMKDIIITAGGKNITPSEIENELKFSPYVSDAVVVGDRRPYLTCLIMVDHDNVENYAQDHATPFSDYRSLCRSPQVQALIGAIVEEVNLKFARVEQIKKFRLIENKLTADDEELTPTMKLKRSLVERKYRHLIDEMYH